MASITLTSGSTTREIELLDAINDDTADNVTIGSYYAELTDDISLTNGAPLLTFTKNGTTKYIRESFIPLLPSGRSIYRHSSGKGSVLIYEDGTEILVLDAQYRAASKGWGGAISYCEGLSVDGQACSCPDKGVLLDIWEDQDAIDARDPTITSYATFALSNWGFGSSLGTAVWSSTPYDSSYAYYVYSSGHAGYDYRLGDYGVVPVLEL